MNTMAVTKESLKEMKADADEMLNQFNEVGERLTSKAAEAMRDAKRSLHRMQDSTEQAVRETKHVIKKNPFSSVALAAGIGVSLGILVGYLWGSQRD